MSKVWASACPVTLQRTADWACNGPAGCWAPCWALGGPWGRRYGPLRSLQSTGGKRQIVRKLQYNTITQQQTQAHSGGNGNTRGTPQPSLVGVRKGFLKQVIAGLSLEGWAKISQDKEEAIPGRGDGRSEGTEGSLCRNHKQLLVAGGQRASQEVTEKRLQVGFRYQIVEIGLVLIHSQGLNSQKSDRGIIQVQSSSWKNLWGMGRWWVLGIKWKPCHWNRTSTHLPGLGWQYHKLQASGRLNSFLRQRDRVGTGTQKQTSKEGRRCTLMKLSWRNLQTCLTCQLQDYFPGEQFLPKHFPLRRMWNVNVH